MTWKWEVSFKSGPMWLPNRKWNQMTSQAFFHPLTLKENNDNQKTKTSTNNNVFLLYFPLCLQELKSDKYTVKKVVVQCSWEKKHGLWSFKMFSRRFCIVCHSKAWYWSLGKGVCLCAVMKPMRGGGKRCRWLKKMLMLEGQCDGWHPEREIDVSSKEEF